MAALKILIIEDDLILAEELKEQLIDFGYVITEIVRNDKDALKYFKTRLPDLVLCDINLKGSKLDGIQIAERFIEIANIPIIFLTAYDDKKTLERAKNIKPAHYLIKPCNPSQLQIAIDIAISNFAKKASPQSNRISSTPPCVLYSSKNFFFVKDNHKYIRVEVANINYIEALGSNVKIVTEKFTVVLAANLSSFQRQVSSGDLFRVHRSFIININKVFAFDSGRAFIRHKEEQKEIPIGKTYRGNFQNALPRLLAD